MSHTMNFGRSVPAGRTSLGRRRFVSCLLLGASVMLASCGKSGDGGGGAGNSQRGRGGAEDTPASVAVEPVHRGTVVARYSTTATLEAENQAQVLARTTGVVVRLGREEGDAVKAGDELLRLDDAEAKLRLRQAAVELAEQTSIFERQSAGIERGVITEVDFDLARANLEAAQANRDLSEHELSYTRVRAPFRGTVIQRFVDVGQTVNPGTALFEIANFKPMLARVHVPGKEFGTLGVGQDVDLVLDSNGKELTGKVHLISPIIDSSTGTIKVTVKIDDYPAGTRPGDFTHVDVVTERRENVLRVPNIAVYEDKGDQVVYVAQDSVAARRVVELGFIDDTHTEITTGLDEAELVVVKGQRSLRDGGRIRILQDGDDVVADEQTATRPGS